MEGLSTDSNRISQDQYGNSKGLTKNILTKKTSIMFNQICINEEMRPKYTRVDTAIDMHYLDAKLNG